MNDDFRCAQASAALGEPLAGTASTARAFLLLEEPGPWGENALRDSRLPGSLGRELLVRCRSSGVRPLLIRRHGRSAPSTKRRCFAVRADAHRPWLEETTLARVDDVLDVDVGALGRGESAGLQPRAEPILLVCTHGRQDICCAELGRPLAAALSRSHPDQTWECSHLGGDRFAGNLLVLPDGLYYGRVGVASAARIVDGHRAGHLDLDHLRGRSGYNFPAQAAEWQLRRRLNFTAVRGLALTSEQRNGDVTEVVFDVAGLERWLVRIRSTKSADRRLTCGSGEHRHALQSELVSLDRLS